jgi:N4-gp56 family major capsid protein
MAGVTTTSTVSAQFRAFFSKNLLSYAVQDTVLEQFAQKQPIPKNSGHKGITLFRFAAPSLALVKSVGEGTALTAGTDYDQLSLTSITKDLAQYAHVIDLTDILTWTGLFNHLDAASKRTGENTALFMDSVMRNVLQGSNLTISSSVMGTAVEASPLDNSDTLTERYGQGQANFAALDTATTTAVINSAAILDNMTKLKINRAPMINGGYVAVVDPRVARDIMRDNDWINASVYNGAQKLYRGEVGQLYGCRIVTQTNSFIATGSQTEADKYVFATAGTDGTAAGSKIFTSFFLGGEAFSIPALSGDDPTNPNVNIVRGADKADPINQHTLITTKLYFTALRQNPNYYIVYRSKSAFV